MFADSSIRRACGQRIRGGVYAEMRLSENGLPLEYFLVDPPISLDIGRLGLASVGVQIIESGGRHHVFDIVGQEYYAYPCDYVEEVRRLGASRRLPANLDFSKLEPGSRLVLVHTRAIIENYLAYPTPPQVQCPKGLVRHSLDPLPDMCAGLWWHDLPGEPDEGGQVLRQIEGGTLYRGYSRPTGVTPVYRHAIFLSLPISNLAVIRGGQPTEQNYQAACHSGLPVYLEEE